MSLIHSSLLLGAGAAAAGVYQIERSLRFNSSDSAFCSRTPASAGNRKKFTYSTWTKLSALGTLQAFFSARSDDNNRTTFLYQDSQFKFQNIISGSAVTVNTSAVFRDPSAWYHILLAVDTDQGTSSNRVRLYVNGVEQTLSGSYPGAGDNTQVNNTVAHAIGRIEYQSPSPTGYFDGYMADVVFIDGQQLTPSSLVETSATTGQLIPKAYTGTFTGNSFWLKFSDNSSTTSGSNVGIGKDFSGLGNYWNSTNLSVTAGAGNDSLVDTPTSYGTGTSGGDVRGNFCTLNPLDVRAAAGTFSSLSNGNLQFNGLAPGGGAAGGIASTIGVSSGKWYSEFTVTATSGGSTEIGIYSASSIYSPGYSANSYSYRQNGNKVNNDTASSYGASYTTNDVIGVALDMDAGTLTFYKNGSTQGQAFSGITGSVFFAVGKSSSAATNEVYCNFGQRAFAYTPPANHKPLVDTYLTSTTITTSGSYTGNGTADGPFVYLNGVPTAMTIGGNAVTFGTHADKLANGFKIRTSSTTYNQNASSYSYSITSTGAAFKNARAQPNP